MPSSDLEQAYTALRNADAAGDTNAATQIASWLKSLQTDPPERGPNGIPKDTWATEAERAKGKAAEKLRNKRHEIRPDFDDDAYDASEYEKPREQRSPIVPIADAALGMATGVGSTIAGGLRGIYNVVTGEGMKNAAQASEATQEKLTYQPRTEGGKALTQLAGLPIEMGQAAGGAVGAEAGRLLGNEAAGRTLGEVAIPAGAAIFGGLGARKSAGKSAERQRVPVAGEDYSPLRDMTPEQRDRFGRQKSQGIEPTLGSVTRDPERVRFEDQTSKLKEGAAIRDRDIANNQALIDTVEKTDKMRAGRSAAENQRETGEIVSTALREKEAQSKSSINELYKAAEKAGETKAKVNTKPLDEYLKANREEAIAVPALSAITNKLAALKRVGKGSVTIESIENLYKAANELSKPGDPSSKFMRDVKSKINDMTEGAGGDMYRQARLARLAHAMEFEDRSAIASLVEKKTGSRTDYKTAAEDVFNKTVVNSSLEELKDVTLSLLNTDKTKSPKAWQAVRELQGQTIDYLIEKSTKGISLDEKGGVPFSPAGFRQALQSNGRDKLDYLLGKDAVNRLYDALKSARELKTSPGRVAGSDTSVNVIAAARDIAGKEALSNLASGFPMARGIERYFRSRSDRQALAGKIDESLIPSRAGLTDIKTEAAQARKANRQFRMQDAGRTARAFVPAALVAEEQPQ